MLNLKAGIVKKRLIKFSKVEIYQLKFNHKTNFKHNYFNIYAWLYFMH